MTEGGGFLLNAPELCCCMTLHDMTGEGRFYPNAPGPMLLYDNAGREGEGGFNQMPLELCFCIRRQDERGGENFNQMLLER